MLQLAYCLLLAACGDSSPPPIPTRTGEWAITQGSLPQSLQSTGGKFYFDFPVCASASVCWISYVEKPWTSELTGKTSISFSYSIIGTTPVFNNLSPGNSCGGTPTLSLLLHRAGDNMSGRGPYAYYRWFSTSEAQPLALGDFTVAVPLTVDKWVPVFNGTPEQNDTGFAGALATPQAIGFGFGGGCFAAHGVSLTIGSARFVIREISVE